LTIPKSLYCHTEPRLDALVQFLEEALPRDTLEWSKKTVVKIQEIRDASIKLPT
jgi:hypothetical protein